MSKVGNNFSIVSDGSGNLAAKSIGALSRRTATFDSGSKPKATLLEILNKKIIRHRNTYQYQEISYHDDIRLLKILHGERGSPLQCMLIPSALPSTENRSRWKATHFWALSYWWGEDEPSHEIQMFDDTHSPDELAQTMTKFNKRKSFWVRDNLAAALEQFRRPDEDVNIWCDAVCINQGNVKEKTAQVARMNEIYSEADSVCVWLGAGNDNTAATFAFLRRLLNLSHLDEFARDGKLHRREWGLAMNLMKNRWFSRRWVIQELVLAKHANVRWGTEQMLWKDFADAIALLMTKHDEIKEILGASPSFAAMQDPDINIEALDPRALGATTLVDATSNLFHRAEDGTVQQKLVSLEALVSSQFLAFEASEPRDTIYAVLSLAKDTANLPDLIHPPSFHIPPKSNVMAELIAIILHSFLFITHWIWLTLTHPRPNPEELEPQIDRRIAPDYDKRLTDVCADFIEYCIDKSQSLDLICRHWAPRPKPLTPREKLEMNERVERTGQIPEVEKHPSWISSIEEHAFGGPRGVLSGRINGDSLVGGLGRQNRHHYNASGHLQAWAKMGKCKSLNTEHDDLDSREPNIVSPVGKLEAPENHTQAPIPQPPSKILPRKFDGTLRVKGLRLGTIEKNSGRVAGGVIPAEAFQYADWPAPSSEEHLDGVPDKLWRTLVANRGLNGVDAPTWYRRACLECLNHINPTGDLDTKKFDNVAQTPATMKMFLKRVQEVVCNRRFFLCKKVGDRAALYGMGPPQTNTGDIICVLFGCSVPVVLRRQDSDDSTEKRYTLVGECYVHGMMDGEALPKKLPEYPYDKFRTFTLV
jgi:hypothetical protein